MISLVCTPDKVLLIVAPDGRLIIDPYEVQLQRFLILRPYSFDDDWAGDRSEFSAEDLGQVIAVRDPKSKEARLLLKKGELFEELCGLM